MGKRRLSFHLRALLAVVAVAAVLSFWMARTVDRASMRAAAIQEIARSEGLILPSGGGAWPPQWLRAAVGDEYFLNVQAVDFATNRGRKAGSDDAKATDEQLALLASLSDLETLELGNNEGITDRGLIHLADLQNLSTLYLYQTGVRGPGLAHLERLPKLHSISLSRSELGDAGLKHLGNMLHLKWADLDQTHITDAGMADLAKAIGLETLSLRRTDVSDEGIRSLESLRNLKSLNLVGTRVTAAGVARLKRALPDCETWTTFGLGMKSSETPLFPEGHQPTASEINDRLKELAIEGEVEVDASRPGRPIVSLRLFYCTLSDDVVLALLDGMPELETLNIRGGLVGDRLLAGLAPRPIRLLSLQSTRVTDEGLKHLSRLPTLQEIDVSETDVTDAGLVHLHGLGALRTVRAEGTRATREGLAPVGKALPNR
jgi:hypothetical protein